MISERQQADLGTRRPRASRHHRRRATPTSVQVAEDVAGSPFGLKLSSVTSSLTGATVTGPSGSPAAVSVDLGATNPNPGDQVSFTFNLPDGTTESVQLTATSTTPPPTGSFAIGATLDGNGGEPQHGPQQRRSARWPTPRWWRPRRSKPATISSTPTARRPAPSPTTRPLPPAPITGATALSGAAGTRLAAANGLRPATPSPSTARTITFVASGRVRQQPVNVTDSVQTLLSKIDSITGTSTPSTIDGGVDHAAHRQRRRASRSRARNATAAFAALGFTGTAMTATQPPLRVSGSPLGSATSLVNGSANTVAWYTGNSGPGSRALDVDGAHRRSQTVQFGAQANEQAIRLAAPAVAVYAAVTASPTGTNSAGADLSAQPARCGEPDAASRPADHFRISRPTSPTRRPPCRTPRARQTQTQTALQNMVSNDRGHQPERGGEPDPAAAEQPAGLLPDHRDALAAQPDQVPAGGLTGRAKVGT